MGRWPMTVTGIEPLFNTLMIVASGNESRQLLAQKCQEFGCKVLIAENINHAIEIAQTEPSIDVVLYEVAAGEKIVSCFDFVRVVRMSHREMPPIFVLCDEAESNLGNVFYEGVTGIFLRPLNVGDLTKAIAVAYAELLGHRDRQFKRRRLHYANATYSSDSLTLEGFVTDISLGGMFIGTQWELPKINQQIKFKLSIVGHSALSGGAIVRWVRPELELGRPRGFGIEFKGVDQATLTAILREPWRPDEDAKTKASDIWNLRTTRENS